MSDKPIVDFVKRTFPFRSVFARLSNFPVFGEMVEDLFFEEGDGLITLPRNEVVEVNKYVGSQKNMVLPSQIVEHFVKEANYHWKMDYCICRVSGDCEDYSKDLGCLFLGEGAKNIHPKHGEQVTEEEALKHLEKCREEGLIHQIGRAKLDTLWLRTGPGEKLLTICNCCPCCCVTNLLPKMASNLDKYLQKMPGVNIEVTEECVGCGTCTEVCFMSAISIEDGKATIGETCRGCGRCVETCPQDAIELTMQDTEFLNKSIENIEERVKVT